MKWVKKAAKVLKAMGLPIPPWVLMLILLLAMAGFAYWAWRKKNPKKPAEAAPKEGEAAKPVVVQIKKNALVKVWRKFVSGAQSDYRRSIPEFQPFIVLGSAGAGKKSLIGAYTDWKKRQQQYPFSQSESGDLGVYLAAQSVVQELPAKLLSDASAAANKALSVLWKSSLFQREPVVVATVNWMDIVEGNADAIRTMADRVRGKINLLSMIRRQPVRVRVALTHLDQLSAQEQAAGRAAGLKSFVAFLDQEEITSILRPEDFDKKSLVRSFRDFERYVQLALTKLPSQQYREVLSVLETFPERLERLALFTEALFAKDPLTHTPVSDGIYITSPDGAGESPFAIPQVNVREPRFGRVFRHRAAAAAIVLGGCSYLMYGFDKESDLYHAAVQATEETRVPDAYVARKFLYRRRTSLRYFPSFFSWAEPSIQVRLASSIRSSVILPKIKDPVQDFPKHQQLYLLTLYHVCPGNSLHERIRGEESRRQWVKATGLSRESIDDYLQFSAPGWPKTAEPIKRAQNAGDKDDDADSEGARDVDFFMERLSELLLVDSLTSGQLEAVKFVADEASQSLNRSSQYALAPKLYDDLKIFQVCPSQGPSALVASVATSGNGGARVTSQDTSEAQEAYRDYFKDVSEELDYQKYLVDHDAWFRALIEEIKGTDAVEYAPTGSLGRLNLRLKELQEPIDDTLPEEKAPEGIEVDVVRWRELVRRSLRTSAIRGFLAANSQAIVEDIFRPRGGESLDAYQVQLNPQTAGGEFFTGKKTVPGLYTRRALEKVIVPQLQEFDRLHKEEQRACRADDPICAEAVAQYDRASDVIRNALLRYSEEYASHWKQYWSAYGIHADSPDKLTLVLDMLRLPVSPLSELIDRTTDNTRLPPDMLGQLPPEYLPRLPEQLAIFKPIHQLASAALQITPPKADGEAAAPEAPAAGSALETYRGILAQVHARLEARSLGAPPDAAADSLEAALGGSGSLALQMLRAQRNCSGVTGAAGSYNAMVADWLRDVRINDSFLQRPFLEPVKELYFVGVRDIEQSLQRAWRVELDEKVMPVLSSFPFEENATKEVTPEELEMVLKPPDGTFFRMIRNYVEPVIRDKKDRGFRLCPGLYHRDLRVPDEALRLVEKVLSLSRRLWDDSGNPMPFSIPFEPEALPPGRNRSAVVSLAYLNAGDTSLVYFNQNPTASRKHLEFDWTQLNSSRVGIRLTDVDDRQQYYPKTIDSNKRYWSLLHLLKKSSEIPPSEVRALRLLKPGEVRYSWPMQLAKRNGGEIVRVSFIALSDPFSGFRELAKTSRDWK